MAGVKPQGMTSIVKTMAGWVKGFILVFGIYIVAYGHLTPGGGFAGGVILALAFVMLVLSYGKTGAPKILSMNIVAEIDSIGGLMFLTIALLGMLPSLGGVFFGNFPVKVLHIGRPFHLVSGGIIPLCNIAIALKVASSLFLLFILLILLRVVYEGEQKVE
ncbi:MAG: MnhB domain-containing protein [Candidatus Eisenbacteria bacterium]